MQPLRPIIVVELFPELLDSLLALLAELSAEDWILPTACTGWSVHDVATHLLGVDVGRLSGGRDRHTGAHIHTRGWADLVAAINARNEDWVRAMRRVSAPLLRSLLRLTGDEVNTYFASLDPFATGGAVSWAGPEPAPNWLDLAREFTERWHHQQHIRDATGRPGMTESRYLAPVLATFVRGMPRTFRDVPAEIGAQVTLMISGEAGGSWTLVRELDRWVLFSGRPDQPSAEVILPADAAWRMFTKGLPAGDARRHARISGDARLGALVLETVSLIA